MECTGKPCLWDALYSRALWLRLPTFQIAVSKFFDGEGLDPVAEAIAADSLPRTEARHENLQETLLYSAARQSRSPGRNTTEPAPRVVPRSAVTSRPPWLLGLMLTPFSFGWKAASGVFRFFLYVLSFLPAPLRPRTVTQRITTGFRSTTGRRMLMPRDTAARFKREFDEEYGSNSLPFFEGGIAQAHDFAKKELKFLLVVLMSPEHDDTEAFVQGTLLDSNVVNYISNPANNIVLWGGNVLDSEAYQVAAEYRCTKFPFSAVVCLTPKEGSTRMGIVKRLPGLLPPSTYLSELQAAVEKYGSDLISVRAERTAQEVARNIRNEQDSAYERSLAIDRERARQRREAAAEAEAAERRAQEEAEAAALLEETRRRWKAWRSARILPEPPTGDKEVVRVALKMREASGAGRIVRRFPQSAPMDELYAFVECYDLLQADHDGTTVQQPEADYEHEYRFRIASTLPRVVYEPSTTLTIGEQIGKSGNLIVEDVAPGLEEDGGEGEEGTDGEEE